MQCINCGSATDTDGKFCPSCGQRLTVKRLTFKEGFLDFWARIYGFDSQFPRTLRDLTLRPGLAARRFIEGNRTLYYGPVGYYFLMITVMFLVASILGIDFNEVMMSRSRDFSATQPAPGSGQAEAQRILMAAVMDNFKIFSFTLVVFVTLWLRVFFRKSGYNLLEHSVMVFFVMGHMYWLSILDLIIEATTDSRISYIFSIAVMIPYFGLAAAQLYNYQSMPKAFTKGILAYLTAYLTFVIVLSVVSLAIFLSDPEMVELLRKKG